MVTRILDPYVDANQVSGDLWQGAYPISHAKYLGDLVDTLVLCARELQPPDRVFPRVEVLRVPLYDRAYPMLPEEKSLVREASIELRKRLDKGKKVLVTCYAGLNRSGLVSALTLMYPQGLGSRGYTFARTAGCLTSIQAVQLVRNARGPDALGNPVFVDFLFRSEHVCRPSRRLERRVGALT